MMRKRIKKAFLLLASLSILGVGVSTSIAAIKDGYTVQAATTSAVDSRFFTATTSKPWTYTDFQGDYYDGCDITATGSTLLSNLATLTNNKYTSSSYDGLKTGLPAICKFANGQSGMVGFYDRSQLTSSWDGGETWNREHTWPNSRGAGESGPGANPFIIMPTSVSINSSRGNKFYGTTSSTWDPGQYDTQFRGAAARCILYAAMQYNSTLSLSENSGDATSKNTMGIKSQLLEWNMSYVPDADEMYRNNLTAQKYGARNPFIDYPYLANNIWGDGSSSGDSSSSSSSDSSSSSSPSSSSSSSSSASKAYTYTQITSASEIVSGQKFAIVGVNSNNVYALSNSIVSNSLPWYLNATSISSSGISSTIQTDTEATLFTVTNNGDSYEFEEETAGHLKSYVSGTHYSIAFENMSGSQTVPEGVTDWTLTFDSDGAVTFKSSLNVYLTFATKYKTFGGSSSSGKLYLYALEEEEIDPTTEATEFASAFNLKVGANCTSSQQATNTPSDSLLASWKEMSDLSKKLSDDALTILVEATDSHSVSDIANCISLYEYICLKYCDLLNSSGGDFLYHFDSTRSQTDLKGSVKKGVDNSLIVLISSIAILASAFGAIAIAVVKRRKAR